MLGPQFCPRGAKAWPVSDGASKLSRLRSSVFRIHSRQTSPHGSIRLMSGRAWPMLLPGAELVSLLRPRLPGNLVR